MSGKATRAFRLHRSAIRQVVDAHRGRNPRVFGSVARGDDADGSDLDLLIDTTETTSLFNVAAMDRAAFEQDLRTQDAVIRNLEVLGEAARNVQVNDPAFVAEHPDIPRAMAYRMRNALSHGYADIDMGTVWNTVRNDLPPLERRLAELIPDRPAG